MDPVHIMAKLESMHDVFSVDTISTIHVQEADNKTDLGGIGTQRNSLTSQPNIQLINHVEILEEEKSAIANGEP